MATIDVWLDELTGATIIITAIISTTDRATADCGQYRQAAGAGGAAAQLVCLKGNARED